MIVEIRPLEPGDDRSGFRSGDDALDVYFRRYAGQNQFRHHIGVTHVARCGADIVGFVTVAPGSLDADDLPSGRRRPPYPLPVLRVARLAVAESRRGCGVGAALLRFAVEQAESLRAEFGCVGLLVDAKVESVAFYARFGFEEVSLVEGVSEVRPAPRAMFLALAAVPRRR